VFNALLQLHELEKKQPDDAAPQGGTNVPMSNFLMPYHETGQLLTIADPYSAHFFVKRHALDTLEAQIDDETRENIDAEARQKAEDDAETRRSNAPSAPPTYKQQGGRGGKKGASTNPKLEDARARYEEQKARNEEKTSAQRAKEAGDRARAEQQARKKHQLAWLEDLRKVFERADKNNDGLLSRAEIIRALRGDLKLPALLDLPAEITQGGGTDGDNSQSKFEEVFQKMDIDDDRAIALEEFQTFCTSLHPTFAVNIHLDRTQEL